MTTTIYMFSQNDNNFVDKFCEYDFTWMSKFFEKIDIDETTEGIVIFQ